MDSDGFVMKHADCSSHEYVLTGFAFVIRLGLFLLDARTQILFLVMGLVRPVNFLKAKGKEGRKDWEYLFQGMILFKYRL